MRKNKLFSMINAAYRLRQSSDDLINFAIAYVITGDNNFKKQYCDALFYTYPNSKNKVE